MTIQPQYIIESARKLRSLGDFDASYDLVRENLGQYPEYQALVWQHQGVFWSNIHAGNVTLTRRNSRDASFLENLWSDTDFRQRFHRQAPDLPPRQQLEQLLDKESLSLLGESTALHWVIRNTLGLPQGILSLTEISLQHRRAEVLLGLVSGAPAGVGASAMLMLFQVFFRVMKFNKLASLVYADNLHAFKSTVHLGFQFEGTLKRHMRDPRSGEYVDIHQLGLLEPDAFNETNQKLMRRLLSPKI